ncbi:MAG: phospho-N-acetylmuramoyl-pentapeptide-transferase [bacterium]|nr:phospho-N-acetylmuramoyl-pentapeptide-transferase [bacterium]
MTETWHLMALAALTGIGLAGAGMPAYLTWAKGHGWGQVVREEGPQQHLSKAGTPTMGGLVLILSGLLASFWWPVSSVEMWIFRLVVLSGAALGFVDDISKVLKRRNLGLKARHKLAVQGFVGLLLGIYLVATRQPAGIALPWIGFVGGAWLVMAVTLLVTAGSINAVNLTDGLDGLAAGTSIPALLAMAFICISSGHPELAVGACGLVGACLGFLWFNAYPARVFMGDTGSLSLGAALACMALLSGSEFWLVLVGGVFVIETLSVIIQVVYFKLTGGKRVFRMSPIHHHFELGGLHEVQVTARFTVCGVVLAIVSVLLYCGVL